MQIIHAGEDLSAALQAVRGGEATLGLVPTMGALHAGHLALVEEARRRADKVAATIFVNPLQFNDPGDLARYPRQEEADLAKLAAAGCDLVWLPTPDDLYPRGFATTVSVGGVSERWEGEHRPGHFDGVATVVAKLLLAVRPNVAIFGEKDWQQLAVIRRMVEDLGIPVSIHGFPTVREAGGLAMSSRNALLSDDDRKRAEVLPEALAWTRRAILGEGVASMPIDAALAAGAEQLLTAGFSPVDYFALVDEHSLEPAHVACEGTRLIAAATLGKVRLIDNLSVASTQQSKG